MHTDPEYVMLPSKREGKKVPLVRKLLPFIFLLVVVAVASWWIGRNSGQTPNEDVKQVSTVPENPSDPQLTQPTTTEDLPILASNSLSTTQSRLDSAPLSQSPPPPPNSESSAAIALPLPPSTPKENPTIPAPPVGFGGLTIQTEPAGSVVLLRREDQTDPEVIRSPGTVSDLPAGNYHLHVSREGYREVKMKIEVIANRLREIPAIKLQRTQGALDIKSSNGVKFEVFAPSGDGNYELITSGKAPALLKALPARTYRLALSRDGWPTAIRDLTIADQMTTEIVQNFPQGSLLVESVPEGAEVWVTGQNYDDPRRAGTTPLRVDVLPTGTYHLTLKHSDGPDQRVTVLVKKGETATAEASWSKRAIKLTSNPPGATVYHQNHRLAGKDNPVTPMTIELAEGSYNLTAIRAGLADVRLKLEVNEETQVTHFAFEYGSLIVNSKPEGASVYLGNTVLGKTPLNLPNFVPGNHSLRIKKERYTEKWGDALVRNGESTTVNAGLIYDPTPVANQDFTNGFDLRMVWVKALNCWVGATEMPQQTYEVLMGTNPSLLIGPRIPVNNVTWSDAVKFCGKLQIAERGQGFVPKGWKYALPTDKQWSVLAKGTLLDQSVTSLGVARENPEKVGSLLPNRLGLYDTRGNVWEWCSDWYTLDVFNREQTENASGKSDRVGFKYKVLRGGSWNRSNRSNLAIEFRLLADPNHHHNYETGFRVVMVRDGLPTS